MKNFVIRKGMMITKGSESYKLWEEKRGKELLGAGLIASDGKLYETDDEPSLSVIEE